MATVPATHTFIDGLATSSEMNSYVRDPLAFLLSPPLAELRMSAAQSFNSGGNTLVQFDTEDVDTDVDGIGGHDNVTQNSRYTARYAGWYQVSGCVEFNANATGNRFAWIRVNGSDVNGSITTAIPSGTLATTLVIRTKKVYLNVGDYVELLAVQSSGAPLTTTNTTTNQSSFSILWVSN